MSCNSDFNDQMMDLNNNYIELNNNDLNAFDNNQYDNQTSIENEFNPNSFHRNVQARDDIVEYIVDTYVFLEKTRSLLLSFCW